MHTIWCILMNSQKSYIVSFHFNLGFPSSTCATNYPRAPACLLYGFQILNIHIIEWSIHLTCAKDWMNLGFLPNTCDHWILGFPPNILCSILCASIALKFIHLNLGYSIITGSHRHFEVLVYQTQWWNNVTKSATLTIEASWQRFKLNSKGLKKLNSRL